MTIALVLLFGFAAGFIATCSLVALIVRRASRDTNPVLHRPVPADPREASLLDLERVDMVLAFAVGDAPRFGTKRYVGGKQ